MASTSFSGGDRFKVVGRLGSGSMGHVYRVRDRDRGGEEVALKLLSRFDAAALYRFKQEFRALADVVHPNLVSLYELITVEDQWMFTMELIDGVDFLTFVRGKEKAAQPSEQTTAEAAAHDTGTTADTVELPKHSSRPFVPVRPASAAQIGRLRGALLQLAEGVRAIHRAGKLHRDIKPSNVLVEPDGRLVLLDLGVATPLAVDERTLSGRVIGTPAYMAPEQANGQNLDEAADWYAVGVMLYEALSGRRPFHGDRARVLEAKSSRPAVPISELAPDTPADLTALCDRLLALEPADRPSGEEVCGRLRAATALPGAQVTADATLLGPEDTLLVGRERELETLQESLAEARRGVAHVLHVTGRSGMGKSALIDAFLAEIAPDDVVVLCGRCYEQESVPYKALDSLIDELTRHLLSLPEEEVWPLLPNHVGALARLFPVLRRVEAVCAAGIESWVPDPVDLRRQAFGALRQLLIAMCERGPLLLCIDDLQWGDTESAMLLREAFRQPAPPPLLLVLSYRPDYDSSAFLREYLASEPSPRRITLESLPPPRARELAAVLLRTSGAGAGSERMAEAIARESGGSPFFVRQLVHYALSVEAGGRLLDEPGRVLLEDLLRERVDRLPHAVARVLQVVSVAAQPIPQALALRAAGLNASDTSVFGHLRRERLIRTTGIGPQSVVETAHDRIRESVVVHLATGALRDHHDRMARALQSWDEADPEAIAVHLEGSGHPERAVEYLVEAAANATEVLAFDRAAALLQRAIACGGEARSADPELWARLGEALGYAGRSREAADAYLAATTRSSDEHAHRLRKLAAEHLLYSGEIDRGMEELRLVMAEVGIRHSRAGRRSLARLILLRARLALRGLESRRERAASPAEQARLDAFWSAAIGFSMVDTFLGVEFQTRYLLEALRCGDQVHIARGLAAEACLNSLTGARAQARARRICDMAIEIADEIGHPTAAEWAYSSRSFVAYQSGNWQEARRAADTGIRLFTRHRTGFAWELSSMQTYHVWCLYYLGELGAMARQVARLLRDARERGDLYSVTNLSTGVPSLVCLVQDRPAFLREQVAEAMSRWSPSGVHLQHYWEAFSLAYADLYEGDCDAALARVDANWRRFRSAMFLRIQIVRLELLTARATANILRAAAGRDVERSLKSARHDIRAMARGSVAGFHHIAAALSAGIASVRGDAARVERLLQQAVAGFDEHEMAMHAAAGRWRMGEHRSDDAGRAVGEQARKWFADQGVAAPERLTQILVPGSFAGLEKG